jgi:hypothetical protein
MSDINEPDGQEWLPDQQLEALTAERTVLSEEDEEATARRIFRQSAPLIAQGIVHTAIHSPNERVRLDAQKYVTERVLGRVGDDAYAENPVETLLKGLFDEAEEHANANSSSTPSDQEPS